MIVEDIGGAAHLARFELASYELRTHLANLHDALEESQLATPCKSLDCL
jgi:hypothetical protein